MRILLLFPVVIAFALQSIAVDLDPAIQFSQALLTGKGFANELMNLKHQNAKDSEFDITAIGRDVKFLCTNADGKEVELKWKDPEIKTKLSPNKPVNFVTHGFHSDSKGEWVKKTVADWVKYGKQNVCAVDWSGWANALASGGDYTIVATKYVRRTADMVTAFVLFLHDEGWDLQQNSLAGHSLGAHISGLVGSIINNLTKNEKKLAAIYGLDPAGPGFTHMDDSIKLDKSDANYVQCIYSDGDLFGTHPDHKSCKENFFANGGEDQPGCSLSPTCDHTRAAEYFQASLNPENKFYGIRKDMDLSKLGDTFGFGNLKGDVDKMGIYSGKLAGDFRVYTKPDYPYALNKAEFLQKILSLKTAKNKTPRPFGR